MKQLIHQLTKRAPSHEKPFAVFGLTYEQGSDQPIGDVIAPLLTNINFNEVGKDGNITDDLLLTVGRMTRSQVGIVGNDMVFATVLFWLEYIPMVWLSQDEGSEREDAYYDIQSIELLECQIMEWKPMYFSLDPITLPF